MKVNFCKMTLENTLCEIRVRVEAAGHVNAPGAIMQLVCSYVANGVGESRFRVEVILVESW